MNFSYDWLQSFFKRKLPPVEKLAELLTMKSFEVSEVKKSGQDFILDIDVLPNRGSDCFSHLGIAREISAIINSKFQIPKYELNEEKKLKAADFLKVNIKNKDDCLRYTAKMIFEVKIAPSPRWIRKRLEVCGLRPINNVVDIANYVMLETGQPLHAFDFEKIESQISNFQNSNFKKNQKPKPKTIIVRKAKKGEKITTLDEEKYDLDGNILVIADIKSPLAIAGIKGGKKAEISEETKTIVLESANFNPRAIRQGSKRIDLKTDASWRFEHGIDPNLTEFAINRAAYLIQEIAKGKIAMGLIDFYPKKVFPKIIKFDLNYTKGLLGKEISKNEILKILRKLEFKILNSKLNIIKVEVPTFRLDISIPEDLIEEISRIYGYQKIPAVFPVAALVPPKKNFDIFWEDAAKDVLKEVHFTEVYNYSFLSEKDVEIFKYKKEDLIEVENPVSYDFQYLRPSLIPNLLKNVAKNQLNFEEIKIFELGKIFQPLKLKKKNQSEDKNLAVIEKKMLTAVMTGKKFYEAKGVIDLLLHKMGISNIWYDEYQPTPEESKISIWNIKKSAEIKIDQEEIGFLGEISPKVLESLRIEKGLVVFDIDFEKLSKLASEEHEYRPISRFPAAVRDIAVLVPREVKVEEVLNKIETTGGNLIRDVDLFDIYEGEELPTGKKNLAFHIIYQSQDRTLTSEEIDEIQNKIIGILEKEEGWEVRR